MIRSNSVSFVLLLTILTLITPPEIAAAGMPHWPQFHGPKRNNLSTETGLLERWPDGGPKLLWTAQGIGQGYSTASIAADRIYTAGNIDDKTVVTAMDMSGRTIWQTDCGKAWTKPYGGTRGTPTIDGDRLYYETPLGDLVCLNVHTGKKLWGLNILDRFGSKPTTWGLAESVLVDNGRVICLPSGPQASMVAFDKLTGELAWKAKSTGDLAGYASSVLAEYQGLRMAITMTSRAMIGVNVDTGELLWQYERVTYADENIITPIFHEGEIFISTIFNAASVKLKVIVQGGKARVEEVWRSDELDNQHGGVILVDGFLYGACRSKNKGNWVCLDWKTGEKKYAERGVGRGSLTYADGKLYILSERKRVALVKAVPELHEVISSFSIPAGGEGPSWAHPVICGGRLYIRYDDKLFAYDVRKDRIRQ